MSSPIPPHLPAAARLYQISAATTPPAAPAGRAPHGPGSSHDPAAVPARSTNHPRQGSRALLSLLARAHTDVLDLAGQNPGSTLAAMLGGGAMTIFGTVLTAERSSAGKLAAGGTLLAAGGTGLLAGAYAVAANRVRARGEATPPADLELGVVVTDEASPGPGDAGALSHGPASSTRLSTIEEEPEETDAPDQARVNTSST